MTLLRISHILPFLAFSIAAQSIAPPPSPGPNSPEPPPPAAAPSDTPVVYVSDFDLDVAKPKPASKRQATPTSSPSKSSKTSSSTSRGVSGVPRTGPFPAAESTSLESENTNADASEDSKEETPADQANTLVKAVSENLIRALKQAGFDARRVDAHAALPKSGVRLRGVFAEADEMNRARRLLVGGDPVGPNIILYVGVNNLKSPEQPLYLLADPPAKDPRHGPVITVTSYSPAARYELSRDPSGEELQKISKKIAADLNALVGINRLALGQ